MISTHFPTFIFDLMRKNATSSNEQRRTAQRTASVSSFHSLTICCLICKLRITMNLRALLRLAASAPQLSSAPKPALSALSALSLFQRFRFLRQKSALLPLRLRQRLSADVMTFLKKAIAKVGARCRSLAAVTKALRSPKPGLRPYAFFQSLKSVSLCLSHSSLIRRSFTAQSSQQPDRLSVCRKYHFIAPFLFHNGLCN